MLVAINSGHYPGLDSGACGLEHTEAELVDKIGRIVCDDLEKVGYETLFIQKNELWEITEAANNAEADLFLSIHMNACNCDSFGTETYYYGSDEGYEFAKSIQHQLLSTMHSFNRGIKEQAFYVLRNTLMPAALAEIDFLDVPDREQYMATHIDEIAHALARGVTDYVEETK